MPHDDAAKTANAWLHSGAKRRVTISDGKQATADVEEVQRPADGADGGAGRNEQQESAPDPNKALREAIGVKRMRRDYERSEGILK
jgi:hypothetical protein